MRRLMPLACSLLLFSSPALAGGFQILEHSAISTGMANARTALADDVSAVYFNPAAVSELPGLQLQLGLTGITLTKLDGTAKGGIIFAIADRLKVPIRFIGVGEGIEDLRHFEARDFVQALFEN